MSEETKNLQTGICPYCGQVNTVSILGDDPELLNQAAGEVCTCIEAETMRRKKARDKKVTEFLQSNFDYPEDEEFLRKAIEIVELWDGGIEAVTVEMSDGWRHRISLKAFELVITSRKTERKDFRP